MPSAHQAEWKAAYVRLLLKQGLVVVLPVRLGMLDDVVKALCYRTSRAEVELPQTGGVAHESSIDA